MRRLASWRYSPKYVDVGISGSKDSRPALNRLMADAKKLRFDAVLVARFNRFARSTRHLVLALEEFNALGVDFLAQRVGRYQHADGQDGLHGHRSRSGARALAHSRACDDSLQRAKAQGKKLGRPRGNAQDVDAIHRLKSEGLTVRQIAQALRTSKSTVARLLQAVP